jgi:hypothetical protein
MGFRFSKNTFTPVISSHPLSFFEYDFLDIRQVFEHGLARGSPVVGFDGFKDTVMTLHRTALPLL